MRIAQITSSLRDPLGGAEQYCIAVCRWLAEQGHEVTLLGAGASERLVRDLAADGVAVRDLRRPRPYFPGTKGRAWQKVAFHGLDLLDSLRVPGSMRAIGAEGFDLIHVHRWQGLGAGVLRARGTPTVHTVHDFALVDTSATSIRDGLAPSRLPLPQRLRARAMRHALRGTGVVVFPTRRTAERHRELGYPASARDALLPHGWSLPEPGKPGVGHHEDTLQVLFMGKLIEDKGVDLLLEAWGTGVDGAALTLAGAGPLEPAVAGASKTDSISFAGWLDKHQQADLLAASDLLVLPSRWPENFPLVVAEALLSGVPVLATTVNAPEMLVDGVNALVVTPTATGIREGVHRLRSEPAELATLKRGALASAAELDLDRHGQRLLEVYRTAGAAVRRADDRPAAAHDVRRRARA